MHEASLVAAMCQQIEDLVAREKAVGVSKVVIKVGEFSGVEKEAFLFAFKAYQKGHPLFKETELILEWIPAKRRCLQCLEEVQEGPPCPKCGSWQVFSSGGDELELSRVELLT